MKCLSEIFVPYDSFLKTNILLTTMSFKSNNSYTCQKKKCKKFL